MKNKLFALLLTLSLLASPNLQAMRLTRNVNSALAARSLSSSIYRGSGHMLAHTQSTHSNEHKEKFNQAPHVAWKTLPAIAIALAYQLIMPWKKKMIMILL